MDKFQEIRDRIIEQINPYSSDSMEGQDYAEDAKSVFDLLRPLLDGWKDVNEEQPEPNSEYLVRIELSDDRPAVTLVWFDGHHFILRSQHGNVTLRPTHFRKLPSLPGDYSALEALITNKKEIK